MLGVHWVGLGLSVNTLFIRVFSLHFSVKPEFNGRNTTDMYCLRGTEVYKK